MSADCRLTHRLSTDCRSTVGRLSADGRPTVGRQSVDCRSTVGRLSVDSRSMGRSTVGRLSTDSRPTVDRQGAKVHMNSRTHSRKRKNHPAAAVSLPQHKSQSAECDCRINVLNLPLSNTKHRHTRVRCSLAPIFSAFTRLISWEKPVTTWLLLNLPEQAYHILFVSYAVEYARSNKNTISSSAELTMPPRAQSQKN